MITTAIMEQLVILFYLKKTEEEVRKDVSKAIKNIFSWVNMVTEG